MKKSKECLNMLMEKIKKKEKLKLDMLNGVILELNYEDEIKAYRGYWEEEKIKIGIWEIETILKIIAGEINDVEVIE